RPTNREAGENPKIRKKYPKIPAKSTMYTSIKFEAILYAPIMARMIINVAIYFVGVCSNLINIPINGKLFSNKITLATKTEAITAQKISGCCSDNNGPG